MRWPILEAFAIAVSVATAHAGAPLDALNSPEVVVATVAKVSDEPATNGNPPRVELTVHQVLRGDPRADRSHAIWNPTPHDIDTSGREAELKAWKEKPMQKPRAGQKFILFGWTTDSRQGKVFQLRGEASTLPSPAALRVTLERIKRNEAAATAYAQQIAAEKKDLARDRVEWRSTVSNEDLVKYARQADFVGIGKVSSGNTGHASESVLVFQVEQLLKGTKRYRYTDNSYYVECRTAGPVSRLLDRDTKYLLFLLDRGTDRRNMPLYARIPLGDGIVIADERATSAVRSALDK